MVGTSSPFSMPAIEYVTFNGPCVSVAGTVNIWWNFQGETSSIAWICGEVVILLDWPKIAGRDIDDPCASFIAILYC
jgi:hypothetical protein